MLSGNGKRGEYVEKYEYVICYTEDILNIHPKFKESIKSGYSIMLRRMLVHDEKQIKSCEFVNDWITGFLNGNNKYRGSYVSNDSSERSLLYTIFSKYRNGDIFVYNIKSRLNSDPIRLQKMVNSLIQSDNLSNDMFFESGSNIDNTTHTQYNICNNVYNNNIIDDSNSSGSIYTSSNIYCSEAPGTSRGPEPWDKYGKRTPLPVLDYKPRIRGGQTSSKYQYYTPYILDYDM